MKSVYEHVIVIIILLLALTAFGCSNPEEEARILQNEALTLEQGSNLREAVAVYEKLVEKYPQTQASVDANKALGLLRKTIVKVDELILSNVTEVIDSAAVPRFYSQELCSVNPSISTLNNEVIEYEFDPTEYASDIRVSGSCDEIVVTVITTKETGTSALEAVYTGRPDESGRYDWECSSNGEPQYLPNYCRP